MPSEAINVEAVWRRSCRRTEDDGKRDDPLLSDRSLGVITDAPDFPALAAARTRIVIGVGEESAETFTARSSAAVAERLGQDVAIFPSHHGGFTGGDSPYAGKPEEFARTLREALT